MIGPGGAWASAAKLVIQKDTCIDFIAGPTEILVLADETGDPEFIALDMLAQAEHDYTASAVLVTTSPELVIRVKEFIEKYVEGAVEGIYCLVP
ncbi:MAG: histidinol dehydrogenase [Desulfurococcales archaeon]|nr:histidinol dehydrogenase [Desulfurococcales archaeon]